MNQSMASVPTHVFDRGHDVRRSAHPAEPNEVAL
jgi:hypothetical protein